MLRTTENVSKRGGGHPLIQFGPRSNSQLVVKELAGFSNRRADAPRNNVYELSDTSAKSRLYTLEKNE